MNWASFHVVELMSTDNVKYKRVGYLAATQSFGDDTDVVLLIPNLLKKTSRRPTRPRLRLRSRAWVTSSPPSCLRPSWRTCTPS